MPLSRLRLGKAPVVWDTLRLPRRGGGPYHAGMPELTPDRNEPPVSGETEPQPADAAAPPAQDDEASIAPVAPETPAADPPAEPLAPAGEGEEAPAEVIDTELAQLVRTPLGLRGAIEALLFASPEPLTPRRIAHALDLHEMRLIHATLGDLRHEYDEQRRGFQIIETAQGFQMATRELFGDLILRLKGRKRRPALSPAALETLAIVAVRQPIIRAEIESIRGVESGGMLRNLMDMGLVEIVGRREVLGRPPMYGTTPDFLRAFGLKTLEDIPSIAELRRRHVEMREQEEAAKAQAAPLAAAESETAEAQADPPAETAAAETAPADHADPDDDADDGWADPADDEARGATNAAEDADGEQGDDQDDDDDDDADDDGRE